MTFGQRSISMRLNLAFAFIAIILATALVAALAFLASTERRERRSALTHSAQLLMIAVDANIDEYVNVGRVLIESPSLARSDIATFAQEARRATKHLDAWVFLASADGSPILDTRDSTPGVLRGSADGLDALARAREAGVMQISDVGINSNGGAPVVSINFPINAEGGASYVMTIAFPPRIFAPLMGKLPEGWLSGVIDRKGNFVTRSIGGEEFIGKPASAGWRAVMGQSGVSEYPSLEGEPIISANVVGNNGWASSVAVYRSALYAPVWTSLVFAGLAGAAAVIACLAMVAGLGRQISGGVKALGSAVVNLQRQQPVLDRTGLPEFDRVIEAMNFASAELAAREHDQAALVEQAMLTSNEAVHRSKNLLAVTSSIASLIARDSPDIETFNARFGERLQALVRCQDLLFQANWEATDIRDVVLSQLAPLAADRFSMTGQSLAVSAVVVQALSLVLFELCTNAMKHGALSLPAGRVGVEWKSRVEGALNEVTIVWQESGGPLVSLPARRGFGSRLITATCQRSLNGRVENEFKTEGLVCTIHFDMNAPDITRVASMPKIKSTPQTTPQTTH